MLFLQRLYHVLCPVFFILSFQANLPSSSSSTTQLCSQAEAAALIQFKSSFSIDQTYSYSSGCDDVGIESYPKTDSWKEGTDCCSWDGVSCDNIKGHVIGLDLSCSWLYGTISSNSSLFQLPHLRKLNLAFNNFNHSKMLSKFGEFASLVHLNLSETSFAGLDTNTFERLVSNLTRLRQLSLDGIDMSSTTCDALMNLSSSLRSLSLYDCDLQGNFPEYIFHLSNLKSLYLGGNVNLNIKFPKLNGSSHLELLDLSFMTFSTQGIDSIGSLQSLKHLDLHNCNMSGPIPMSVGNLSQLCFLDMSLNQFTGQLPTSLSNLSQLEFLYLYGNQLESRIPDELLAFPNLIILDLSFNLLNGRLPDSIGNLVSLKQLNLRECSMSAPIPEALGNLSQLTDLDLSHNSFSGQIPSSLTNLRQLEFLTLEDNQLEGCLPDEVITAFPNLISLDLSRNSLNGTLPSWLYSVSSLKSIDLSNNHFSGHLKEFQSNSSLESIYFDNNKLQGPILSSISQLTNLTVLTLSSNYLSGVVDFDMFSQLQQLSMLDLSQNSLSFNSNHTSAGFTLPNLQYLVLSSCNLTEFPQFLKGLEGLIILDLSRNRIHGKIPKWMWDVGKDSLFYLTLSHNFLTQVEQVPWKAIQYLDLSSNQIRGYLPIPPSGTTVFLISNNSLSGEISSRLCNLRSLQILDLFHNNLTGVIPQCFGGLSKSLSTLNLGMNKFYGIIPPTLFAKGCQLSFLNLNGNQLEGPLPRSINNCRDLEVLDFGNNKINDTFPYWMGSLPELKALVLKSNQLHGSINGTRSSRSFSSIQIFDLSSNYFTGPLPLRYIKNFKAMRNLTKKESALSYIGVGGFNEFYNYTIGLGIKGLETEMMNIFTLLTTIDLSNNMFVGEIPVVMGKLNSLEGLNLSHNNLNGCIPSTTGNLINLEWLDLSSNMLVGKIPESLVDLTFLSFLNLSGNQLQGQIPQGKQFNTFGNDSYEGNKGLCGFPVSKGCSNNEPPRPPSNLWEGDDGSKSSIAFGWKVVLIGYCCGLVFGLALGFIVFRTGKPKWFVTLVEDKQHKRPKKSKISNRRGVGRRI